MPEDPDEFLQRRKGELDEAYRRAKRADRLLAGIIAGAVVIGIILIVLIVYVWRQYA